MNLILTPTLVQAFTAHLHSMERAPATVSAYRRAVNDLLVFAGDKPLNRELLIRYKHALVSRGYAPVTGHSDHLRDRHPRFGTALYHGGSRACRTRRDCQ